MALSASQITATWRALVDGDLAVGQTFTKDDLAAAVTAADTWATSNAASFSAALPIPFRTTASAAQKAALLAFVALRRWSG